MEILELKKLTLIFVLITLFWASWHLFKGNTVWASTFLALAFIFIFLWFFYHDPLLFFFRFLLKVGKMIGEVIHFLMIFTIYFLCLCPLSFLSKLCGKKWLPLAGKWIIQDKQPTSDISSYEKTF
ncbi:MAG: hypothetical protein A3G38_02905 [Omnitrophica WOR_2 bacterium RIFCSPLOWO2_12_FULL_51_8]|nr:MAG: hypothetical protein A3G38_02905 [Omnitrophica WOR_2 bacterium RIFCSPLOWO2_12_FULL_51_8]